MQNPPRNLSVSAGIANPHNLPAQALRIGSGKSQKQFVRKVRIVRGTLFVLPFAYHDHQFHTRNEPPKHNACPANEHADPSKLRPERRSMLERRHRSRPHSRREVRVCGIEYWGLLPSVVSRTTPAARECQILFEDRRGRTGRLSRLLALPSEVCDR